jgi:hypothetical protein
MDERFTTRVVKAATVPKPKQPQQYPHRNLRRLTGQQLHVLLEAAQQIRQGKRDAFLARCAIELGEHNLHPGDGDVARAVRVAMEALREHRSVTL